MAPRVAYRPGFHPLPLQTVREVLPHTAFRQPSPGTFEVLCSRFSCRIEVLHSTLREPRLEFG
jgi:hypothetical protein